MVMLRLKEHMKWLVLIMALCVGLFLTGCGGSGPETRKLVVGGKNFTEQYILAELAGILLEQEGFDVTLKTGVSSVICRDSLLNDQIDLYYEYTGTAYTVYYDQNDPRIMRDPEQVYQWVKSRDADKGLTWLAPVQFNNTYTLLMRAEQAEKLAIRSLSDLASYVNDHPDDLVFAVGSEFYERPDGYKKVLDTYSFEVPLNNIKKMQIGLTYKALRDEQVDVAMGFATDGRIPAFNFDSLDDDKNFFPVYNPAPVVRQDLLKRYPSIAEALNPLASELTTKEIRDMNATVDIEHKAEHAVAMGWLRAHGLLNEESDSSTE